MMAERAYISISHHPPGIDIDDSALSKAGEESFGGHLLDLVWGRAGQAPTGYQG